MGLGVSGSVGSFAGVSFSHSRSAWSRLRARSFASCAFFVRITRASEDSDSGRRKNIRLMNVRWTQTLR
jgi:hypothetical protein